LVLLGRTDALGAITGALLIYVLLRGRAATLYAGVFLMVGFLELYGTSIGAWHWAATAPDTPLPTGNPPSGIAGVYVLFDVAAIAIAPRVLAAAEALRHLSVRERPALPRIGPALGRSPRRGLLGLRGAVRRRAHGVRSSPARFRGFRGASRRSIPPSTDAAAAPLVLEIRSSSIEAPFRRAQRGQCRGEVRGLRSNIVRPQLEHLR
jgi:hypothetical protein